MSYLECSDDETVDSTNNVSRCNHVKANVKLSKEQMDKVGLCQMIILRQVRNLSVTH